MGTQGDITLTSNSRSREGAWIEIVKRENGRYDDVVAPVRERGLK